MEVFQVWPTVSMETNIPSPQLLNNPDSVLLRIRFPSLPQIAHDRARELPSHNGWTSTRWDHLWC